MILNGLVVEIVGHEPARGEVREAHVPELHAAGHDRRLADRIFIQQQVIKKISIPLQPKIKVQTWHE